MALFNNPDTGILDAFGEEAVFEPYPPATLGAEVQYDVVLAQSPTGPNPEIQPGALIILFGQMEKSGFVAVGAPYPKIGDRIYFDGELFRVFDVQTERSGGSRNTNGFYLYLDSETT